MSEKTKMGWRQMLAAVALSASGMAASGMAAHAAGDVTLCAGALSGAYLTTIRNSAGGFASRSLVTLRGDGTIDAVDSAQYRGVQKSGFTSQRGTYRCAEARKANARTLNFSFPPHASIARSEWTVSVSESGAISGTITLYVYDGLEGVDPFGKPGKLIDIYRFTGARIEPAEKK